MTLFRGRRYRVTEIADNIAEKIISLRVKTAMTQQDLADRLSVSRSLVSLWELGKRLPDDASISKMAALFDVEESYFYDEIPKNGAAYDEALLIEKEIKEFTGPHGEDGQGTRRNVKLLEDFLEGTGRRDREIFLSRYLDGKSCKEIGYIFLMSEVGVRVKLLRIRKKLRNYIEKEGGRI
ncbi:MAG: helix-turn-helix domain-containing protein [Clostridia bacterium]|nr:helix-turn-helix domain-containing protein [Clostridia bacterium]